MPAPISRIGAPVAPELIRRPQQSGAPGEFQSVLESTIQRVEQLRTDASQAVEKLITGESDELHAAALATQKAELAFELGLQVRNKIVQAYQEVMKMQM